MPDQLATLRFPYERVLLARTKLAYVHLRNLLTDAKRDRGARLFGYVALWLPDELLLLYLQEGELVNATRLTTDGSDVIALADALQRVPHEPELGEVCFHQADDEQLACMFATQTRPPEEWPTELNPLDPTAVFPYLDAMTYDGVLEVIAEGAVNYLVLRDGRVTRAFLASAGEGSLPERVQRMFAGDGASRVSVRRWSVPEPLPQQAAPALVQAYRDLVRALIERLVAAGRTSAPEIAEHARRSLAERHTVLARLDLTDARSRHDPSAEQDAVTAAVAAWIAETLWAAADHDTVSPEELLRDLTRERRHMLQSAGFYDRLPFRIEW